MVYMIMRLVLAAVRVLCDARYPRTLNYWFFVMRTPCCGVR